MPGVPSSCPKLNFVTAPRAAPKDAANTNNRTFLATPFRMLANLLNIPNKPVNRAGASRTPAARLCSPAVTSQEMERVEVLFGQPLPALSFGGRPQVARYAAGQTFAVIVNLGQRLLTLVAASALVVL